MQNLKSKWIPAFAGMTIHFSAILRTNRIPVAKSSGMRRLPAGHKQAASASMTLPEPGGHIEQCQHDGYEQKEETDRNKPEQRLIKGAIGIDP